jgi:hypothetical protein
VPTLEVIKVSETFWGSAVNEFAANFWHFGRELAV